MGNSKDPNRYDPDFFEVLDLMEQGLSPINIERPTTKNAHHFKLRLYAFTDAWKHEGLKLSKDNPELSRASYDRARVMARYRLKHEGNLVICENRDAENFPTQSKITVGSERAPLLTAANQAERTAEILKELPKPEPKTVTDDPFEAAYQKADASIQEEKKKLLQGETPTVPEHPELKLTPHPKAYAFDRPTEKPKDPQE